LPEHTHLFRLFATHQDWTERFLVEPWLLSVIYSYGIELIHLVHEGHSPQQNGKKRFSNQFWIVGGKLYFLLDNLELIAGWDCVTAYVHDSHLHPLIVHIKEKSVVFADHDFFSKNGNPSILKICERYTNNKRMIIETAFSILITIYYFKKAMHRFRQYLNTRLTFTMVAYNGLVQ
jgi:hypothetical protein